jgi:hypothetical protein
VWGVVKQCSEENVFVCVYKLILERKKIGLGVVSHTYNSKLFGRLRQEDQGLRPAWQKLVRHYFKNKQDLNVPPCNTAI